MRCRLDSQWRMQSNEERFVWKSWTKCHEIPSLHQTTSKCSIKFKTFSTFQYLSISFYNLLDNDFFLPLLWMFVLHCAAGAAPQTSACRGTHSWLPPTSPWKNDSCAPVPSNVRVDLVHVGALPSLPPFVLLHSYINIIIHIQYRTILYIYTHI